jgi:uncharacterized protein (DUF2147 family)
MRVWFPALLVTLLAVPCPAWSAPDATGEWLVESGRAHIRIVDCGGILWGVVSWERTPGLDSHNPDEAKRGQPTLGIPVLRNMKPGDDPGQWEGEVYNAQNGKTYDASIELREDGALHVEGCVLGVLCGGEDWKRLIQPQPAQTQTGKGAGTTGAAGTPARPSDADICAGIAGRPH